MSILLAIILILISSTFLGKFVERFNVPSVVGQLLAGIILGPAVLNLLQVNEMLDTFSELGVILLMFIAGLECNLQLLKKYLTPAFLVGCLGVIIPLGTFFLFAIGVLKLDNLPAVFLGLIFSATSVSISAAVLSARKKLDTVAGSVILGAAVVDDIIVIMLLSVMTSFASSGNLDLGSLTFWWEFVGLKVVFFVGIFLFWKLINAKFNDWFEKLNLAHKTAIIPVILCLVGAYFAEATGMSDVIGAFLVGMILSTQRRQKDMMEPVESIGQSFFIPIFFAVIGLNLSLTGVLAQWPVLIGLTILAFLTKIVGSYVASRGSKLGREDSTIISIGMISRGEMALIIVEIGRHLHLLEESLLAIVILVIILTTVFSPLLLNKYLDQTEKTQPNKEVSA